MLEKGFWQGDKKKNCRVVKQEAVHVCSRFHKETVAGVEEEE